MMSKGRPRNFDSDAVVEKAMIAFWQQGYEGVSMDLLCKLTKLTKPSFYNAFKSKEQLFLICLQRYQQEYVSPLLGLLISNPDPIQGVSRIMKTASLRFQDPKVPAGCLVMTGALEAKGKTKKIDKELDRLQSEMLRTIEGYFAPHAKSNRAAPPVLIAQFLISQLYAMAMFSKTNPKIFNFEWLINETQSIVASMLKMRA